MFTLQRTKVHGGALFTEQANCRSLFSFLWTIGSTLESRHCSLLHVRSVFCTVYWAPCNLQGILCILYSGLYIIQFKLCSAKYTAQCTLCKAGGEMSGGACEGNYPLLTQRSSPPVGNPTQIFIHYMFISKFAWILTHRGKESQNCGKFIRKFLSPSYPPLLPARDHIPATL